MDIQEREKRLKILIKELHPTKNKDLDVSSLKSGSGKKLWWKCHKGHIWETRISNRVYHSTGCPKCKKGKVFKHPLIVDVKLELLDELHPEKNKDIDFHKLTGGSEKRVWWLCENGHEWNTTATQRYKIATECPYCSGKLATKENNLLADNHQLSKQWNYVKNKELKPEDFVPRSQKKVWWKCNRGHEYKATIYNRNKKYQGCPKCHSNTSQFELRLLAELSGIFKGVNHQIDIDGYESDVFIKKYNLGMDYDGLYYHKDKKRVDYDKKKIKYFEEQGIVFIKIRDVGLPSISKNEIYTEGFEAKIDHLKELLRLIRSKVQLNKTDKKAVQNYLRRKSFINNDLFLDLLYRLPSPPKEKSLSYLHPKLITEWHNEKNGTLTPNNVSEKSNLNVWWICPKGHDYKTKISNRIIQKSGCPFCARQKVSYDESLLVTHQKIAKTWHPTKNGDLKPSQVFSGTDKNVWWQCAEGHEWDAVIYSRVKHGCPYCSGRKTATEDSIQITYPTLANEWHPTKNGDNTPLQFSQGSGFKAWWLCSNGHSWQAAIYSRKTLGCPYCSGRHVTKENNLKVKNPVLAKQWHPTKNGTLKPEDVLSSVKLKVWWLCENGHEWESTINNRSNNLACPHCIGKIPSIYNNLGLDNPTLAAEWHPTKNRPLTPSDVTKGSGKKVWWKCKRGHKWQAVIASRNNGRGCPDCRYI